MVPSYTRFIKLVQTQFHSKLVQTKIKDAYTAKYKFWDWWKMLWEQKTEMEIGEKWPSMSNLFHKRFMASCGKKRLLQSLNSWIYSPIGCATPKTKFPTVEMWKQHKDAQERSQPLNINKTTSQPWEKWRTLQKHEWRMQGAPKNMRKRKTWMHGRMGICFWVLTCRESQKTFFQNGFSAQFELFPYFSNSHAITTSTNF